MAINVKENGKISYHSDDVTQTHEAGKLKHEGGHFMTDAASNIKIGGLTGSPADTLDVAGRIVLTSREGDPPSVASNQGYIWMDASGDLRFVSDTFTGGKLTDAINLVDADGDTKIQVQESADEDKIRFDTAGTERMIIDNTGLVGIGTATPASQPAEKNDLVIGNNTGNRGMTIASTNTGVGTIRFAPNTSANDIEGWIDYSGNSKKMRFGTNGLNTRMTIDSAGLIGIGTNNPTKLLHLSSATRSTPHVLLESTENNAANNGSVVQFTKTKTGATNDVLGRIQFFGKDGSGNAEEQFASISSQIEDPAHGSENGLLAFRVANNGADECPLLIKSGKVVIGPNITVPSKTVNATLDIEDNTATGTDVVRVTANALETGKAFLIESTSAHVGTRVLARIENTAAAAINATPLSIKQHAVHPGAVGGASQAGIPLMDFEGKKGSVMALKYKEISVTLAAAASTDVIGFIPQYAIPIALGLNVTTAIVDGGGSAASISKIGTVNDSGNDNFGIFTGTGADTLSTVGQKSVTPFAPLNASSEQAGGGQFTSANSDLKITHSATLSAGVVTICLWYYKLTPPQS